MAPDRYWFLTWTTYGTWLPGDPRGSVTSVKVGPGQRHRQNQLGTPFASAMPGLRSHATQLAHGPPIFLIVEQAEQVLMQFHETSAHRDWLLIATAIMRNHIHVEVGVPGDPDPEVMLRDYKSYASRQLNQSWPRPPSGTWWTESGSKRKLKDESAVLATAKYIRDQEFPLAIWVHPEFACELPPAAAPPPATSGG